jgi:peptide deformylase
MVLPIVKYGHPALRQKGVRIQGLTPEIQQLIRDMLETMKEAHGVGLAAQQVGRPLQLTVVDVTGIEDRPSTLEVDGQTVPPESRMPMVLINPQLTPSGDAATGPEGCLSFPEIYAEITRPESVTVQATNERGDTVSFKCGGLLARAIQHEYDHLQGILFIDRMSRETKEAFRQDLESLQAATKQELQQDTRASVQNR